MSRPFFEKAEGLRFSCTRCGNCCTRPGPVYFPESDLRRAAQHLGLSTAEFRRRYKLVRENGMDLLDPPDDQPCVFHDDEAGCTIYAGRPTQCRTWPFWPETVLRERSWGKAALDCEGIGQGDLHPPRLIREALDTLEALEVPEGDPW